MDRSTEYFVHPTSPAVRQVAAPRSQERYAPRRTGTGYGRSSGWAQDRRYAENSHRELMRVR